MSKRKGTAIKSLTPADNSSILQFFGCTPTCSLVCHTTWNITLHIPLKSLAKGYLQPQSCFWCQHYEKNKCVPLSFHIIMIWCYLFHQPIIVTFEKKGLKFYIFLSKSMLQLNYHLTKYASICIQWVNLNYVITLFILMKQASTSYKM